MDGKRAIQFWRAFEPFADRVTQHGLVNSLCQTLIKLTAPGVPDTYQGTELWDFTLVDPDNRRPIDYQSRSRMLTELKQRWESDEREAFLRSLLENPREPRIKLFLTWRALDQRQKFPALFSMGHYVPIQIEGPLATTFSPSGAGTKPRGRWW